MDRISKLLDQSRRLQEESGFDLVYSDNSPMDLIQREIPEKIMADTTLKHGAEPSRRRSHYAFLEEHFDTILTRMGQAGMILRRGSFVSSGDKYYQYDRKWSAAGISFFHGAVMYHLLELLYYKEARQTPNGWVDPSDWVILNYRAGHNLSQYMKDLV